ncbi:MAG: signal transduction histidine kinase, nitrogen specific, NtrB [Gemmatimonadetes bacterium]|jgi:DNA-binding NtrC family response regulator|nr:signal transduction histidine kinase, nitrogen specific, NtrB [Gemmatimonadota bacterium]
MTTLLYVDDEETIGRAVARWFSRRGHIVHVAPSVAEAQRLMGEHEPDVVFIDVWLGQESGFELMSWIEDSRPALADRVVFVTGELADATSADRVFRTLGRPVLQKPFEFSQLEQYVSAAGPRGATAAAPGGPAEKRSGA